MFSNEQEVQQALGQVQILQRQVDRAIHSAAPTSPLQRLLAYLQTACGPASELSETRQLAYALMSGSITAHLLQVDRWPDAARRFLENQSSPACRPVLVASIEGHHGAVRKKANSPDRTAAAAWWDLLDLSVFPRPRLNSTTAAVETHLAIPLALQFFERLLAGGDRRVRQRRGVYFTPQPLTRFAVKSIEEALKRQFQLPAGFCDLCRLPEHGKPAPARPAESTGSSGHLRDAEPNAAGPVTGACSGILDPALGTGVFLLEVITCCHQTFLERAGRAGIRRTLAAGSDLHRNFAHGSGREAWSRFVDRAILPRISGVELLLPAAVVAHLILTAQLIETGYDFAAPPPLRIGVGNSLNGPGAEIPSGLDADSRALLQQLDQLRYEDRYGVVLGNPPFSGVSANRTPWSQRLLRGQLESSRSSYYECNGKPLGERKHWLQDDYVKFIRYAQWQLERAGRGVVGLVTSHGYLDNATFRGMRQQLSGTFSPIYVVDFHGNKKKHEQPPSGQNDQSVFPIGSGVAVGIFCRTGEAMAEQQVMHGELWGTRREKLAVAAETTIQQLARTPLAPTAPHFLYAPSRLDKSDIWQQAIPLPEAMPLGCTAAVTARDSLVVAQSREELMQRMAELRNREVSEEHIREHFFPRARSVRYPPGDTRGWRLQDARRRLAEDPDWQEHVEPCAYRPFDRRFIYWVPWMIDWPRAEVMQHVVGHDNLMLVARRQMLPGQPCNFFWVADSIVLDGLIRSDNRGSESLFPLYRFERQSNGVVVRRANFSDRLLQPLCQRLQCRWLDQNNDTPLPAPLAEPLRSLDPEFPCRRPGTARPIGEGRTAARTTGSAPFEHGGRRGVTPEDVFAYINSLFHAPQYQTCFAEQLRMEFPRVLLPRSPALFWQLAERGHELLRWQLGRVPPAADSPTFYGATDSRVTGSFPKWQDDRVMISPQAWFAPVTQSMWQFRVGAHQVCRKWLRDRRGRVLDAAAIDHYRRILLAARQIPLLAAAIDELVRW